MNYRGLWEKEYNKTEVNNTELNSRTTWVAQKWKHQIKIVLFPDTKNSWQLKSNETNYCHMNLIQRHERL